MNHLGLSNIRVFKIIPFVVACLSIWQMQKSVLSHEGECNCPTKLRRKTHENILILYNKRDLVLRGSAGDCVCIKKISTGIRVKERGFRNSTNEIQRLHLCPCNYNLNFWPFDWTKSLTLCEITEAQTVREVCSLWVFRFSWNTHLLKTSQARFSCTWDKISQV